MVSYSKRKGRLASKEVGWWRGGSARGIDVCEGFPELITAGVLIDNSYLTGNFTKIVSSF
jgi:hypothetical protein